MRYVLGLDLRGYGQGAASFAGWIRSQRRPEAEAEFMGMHVVGRDLRWMEPKVAAQIEDAAKESARRVLSGVDLSTAELSIVAEVGVEERLADATQRFRADALVIGRRARTAEDRLVRLGRVARRLLRSLPTTVIVTPPNIASDGVAGGPVILALDTSTDPCRAATFARRFAEAVDRPLELAHVYTPLPQTLPYMPAAHLKAMVDQHRESQRDAWRRWVEKYALGGLTERSSEGAPLPELVELGRESNACLMICNSRELSTAARVFTSSLGSQLAAVAPFPVAVVPKLDQASP